MHNSDDFVAVIAILTIFGLPLALAIANRVYSHQERLEMIRRGMVPPIDPRWARRMSRQGFDPSMQQATQNGDQYDMTAQFQADRTLRKGITLTMIGFALFIGLFFINPDRPGPWLLGGLIPLFVGIAQIILGVLSGARIGAWGLSAPPQQPPPSMPSGSQYTQAPPNGNQRDVSPGAYAWRPGPTPELERPVPPPDVK